MTAAMIWATVGIVLAAWVLLALTAGIAEAMVRRRMRELDELHAWREKVEAMRRIYDEEGHA